jgi:hypothetical protein
MTKEGLQGSQLHAAVPCANAKALHGGTTSTLFHSTPPNAPHSPQADNRAQSQIRLLNAEDAVWRRLWQPGIQEFATVSPPHLHSATPHYLTHTHTHTHCSHVQLPAVHVPRHPQREPGSCAADVEGLLCGHNGAKPLHPAGAVCVQRGSVPESSIGGLISWEGLGKCLHPAGAESLRTHLNPGNALCSPHSSPADRRPAPTTTSFRSGRAGARRRALGSFAATLSCWGSRRRGAS